MLFRPKMKGSFLFLTLLILLLCAACGKIGDPVPPEHLQLPLIRDLPQQSTEQHDGLMEACGTEDFCKKTNSEDIEVRIKD